MAMLELLILDAELLDSAGTLLVVPPVRTEDSANVEEDVRQ
jgi:hypothetical protein